MQDRSLLQTRFESLQRENANLKSLVGSLEQDIKLLISQLHEAHASLLSSQMINFKKGDDEVDDAANCKDTCKFCNPMLCRVREKRIQMIPFVVSILIKNDFIGAKELGELACTSRGLKRYICSDSDDDTWSTLLHKKWPSTSKIPRSILNRLTSRCWYERFATAVCPGSVELLNDAEADEHINEAVRKELVERRYNFMHELKSQTSISNVGDKFPPLAAPSLAAHDILFLADISCGGKVIISSAFVGESSDSVPFVNYNETENGSDVIFEEPADNLLSEPLHVNANCVFDDDINFRRCQGALHVVRLTDFKLICLAKIAGCIILTNNGESIHYLEDVPREQVENPDEIVLLFPGCNLGSIPTLLTSRIQSFNDEVIDKEYFCSFSFDVRLMFDMPRSPRSFGYDYTVQKFKEHQRAHRNSGGVEGSMCFYDFSNHMWENAAIKPDLAKFLNTAEHAGAKNGKYLRKRPKFQLRARIVIEGDSYSHDDMRYNEGDMAEIALLHVLEDLFDHDEPPLELTDYQYSETSYLGNAQRHSDGTIK